MATILEENENSRPTGTGFEGPGPDVNLPSLGPNSEQELPVVEPTISPAPVIEPVQQEPLPIVEPAVTADNWEQIQEALGQGYKKEEVSTFLQQTFGISPEEANQQVLSGVQTRVKQAEEQGYSSKEIGEYLKSQRYDSRLVDEAIDLSIDEAKRERRNKPLHSIIHSPDPNKVLGEKKPFEPEEEAKDLADLYKNIYGKYSTTAKSVAGIFDEESGIEARKEINDLNKFIAQELQGRDIDAFINPSTGELMMRDDNGNEVEVDSSLVNDLFNAKAEFGGAVAGAIQGVKTGAKVGAGVGIAAGNLTGIGLALPEEIVTGPLGATVGGIIGGVVGSATGATAGRAFDLTINSILLKENIEAKLYMSQMKEAAIFDGVATIVGAGMFRMAGAGYKQILKAYDFAVAGNTQGAYKALLDNMLITDEQAKEIVQQWEKQTGTIAPGASPEEQAIGIISTTQQGAEAFVNFAASKDPRAAMQVITDIDARAKDLLKMVDTVADDNVGDLLRKQLGDYEVDVKQFFGGVRDIAGKEINGTDFRFDYDKLAIDPMLKDIDKGISNPMRKEQFVLYANRIADASQDRTFSGLLNLRQAVNEFKYSRTNLKKTDLDALNKVLNKVDSQIGKAVKEHMPSNGKEWLKQFGTAKTEYAKMKQLKKNVLFRAVTRPGMTEESIQKALLKYIDALDNTFIDVMEKVPPKTKVKVEGAVMKRYIDRYTLGQATDKQAVHLPMVARALEGVKMTTPEAKYLQDNIEQMAKIFRNDPNLSRVSGNISLPKFQSYLTTDPVVRLKFEVASGVFNAIKTKIPGKQANNMALLKTLEKTLENPLHVSSVDKFIRNLPKESRDEVRSLVKELQIEMTKNPVKQSDFKNMFKQTKTGKLTTSNGALGKGVYLVDSVKNPVATSKVIREEVNLSRMATLDDISAIVGRTITEKDIRTLPDIQKQLIDKGYLGIRVEGKAMLFPENKLGVKTPTKSISK